MPAKAYGVIFKNLKKKRKDLGRPRDQECVPGWNAVNQERFRLLKTTGRLFT